MAATPTVQSFREALAAFVPRRSIDLSTSLPKTYYLGHHVAALQSIQRRLPQLDLVIECRDARIPLTSTNPLISRTLGSTPRLVVFTHADLVPAKLAASPASFARLPGGTSTLKSRRDPVLWRNDVASAKQLLHILETERKDKNGLTGLSTLVIGLPNVGKSTLLNTMRAQAAGLLSRGHRMKTPKAAQTGDRPGVTRKVHTPVRISGMKGDPESTIYMIDAPGVGLPHVPDPVDMVKLAACATVKDGLVDATTIVDYLLFHMNGADGGLDDVKLPIGMQERGGAEADPEAEWEDFLAHVRKASSFGRKPLGPAVYARYSHPTNDVTEFLSAVARRTGKLGPGGQPELGAAAQVVLRQWRDGLLGRYVLDDLSEAGVRRVQEEWENPTPSTNQLKKQAKEEIKARHAAYRASSGASG